MGFRDTSLICKIVFFVLILCFIIDIIGCAIPYWFSTDSLESEFENNATRLTFHGGLWAICARYGLVKDCVNLDSSRFEGIEWLIAVRAFSILSMICFWHALVLLSTYILFLSNRKLFYLGAIGLSFGGAFCALVAFAVYAGKAESLMKEYSAGFALTIIAFILGLIIGFLGFIGFIMIERENKGHINT